jgi:hypothetical protein
MRLSFNTETLTSDWGTTWHHVVSRDLTARWAFRPDHIWKYLCTGLYFGIVGSRDISENTPGLWSLLFTVVWAHLLLQRNAGVP